MAAACWSQDAPAITLQLNLILLTTQSTVLMCIHNQWNRRCKSNKHARCLSLRCSSVSSHPHPLTNPTRSLPANPKGARALACVNCGSIHHQPGVIRASSTVVKSSNRTGGLHHSRKHARHVNGTAMGWCSSNSVGGLFLANGRNGRMLPRMRNAWNGGRSTTYTYIPIVTRVTR